MYDLSFSGNPCVQTLQKWPVNSRLFNPPLWDNEKRVNATTYSIFNDRISCTLQTKFNATIAEGIFQPILKYSATISITVSVVLPILILSPRVIMSSINSTSLFSRGSGLLRKSFSFSRGFRSKDALNEDLDLGTGLILLNWSEGGRAQMKLRSTIWLFTSKTMTFCQYLIILCRLPTYL